MKGKRDQFNIHQHSPFCSGPERLLSHPALRKAEISWTFQGCERLSETSSKLTPWTRKVAKLIRFCPWSFFIIFFYLLLTSSCSSCSITGVALQPPMAAPHNEVEDDFVYDRDGSRMSNSYDMQTKLLGRMKLLLLGELSHAQFSLVNYDWWKMATFAASGFKHWWCIQVLLVLQDFQGSFVINISWATQVFLCCIFWTFFQSVGNFGDPSVIRLPRETTRDRSCGDVGDFQRWIRFGSQRIHPWMKRLSREDRCSQLERDMAWVWVLEWKWAWKYFKGGEDQMIRSSKSARVWFRFEFIFWFWGGWDGCCYKISHDCQLTGVEHPQWCTTWGSCSKGLRIYFFNFLDETCEDLRLKIHLDSYESLHGDRTMEKLQCLRICQTLEFVSVFSL